ncbi:MAG: helix-turn-helix transcriptional regulator [Myxococcales bacterium]|nr:helix-turn-helix transcriptional regulator [Myxococcales bacterium]
MVARRNAPHCKRPRDLTASERRVATLAAVGHSNKLIAYELGTTTAAVAMQLTRSARKLGVKSRVELIRAMQPTLGPMPEAQ